MPELGGSYFTFSNENNDLIWGFLAECHRRGWIYKGHDSMPWCPRCGTGPLPDGDERGLPGPRGSRADRPVPARRPARANALLVWTTTPWTLAANVAAAVGPGPAVRARPPGRRRVLARQGDASGRRWSGPFEVLEERPGRDLVGWRYTGPYDDLPAVGEAFAEEGAVAASGAPYEHRVVAWDEVGEDEGTGIVHVAPGCGAEDFQLGHGPRAAGHRAPSTRPASTTTGFGWLDRPRGAERWPTAIVDDLERRGFFYHLEPYTPPLPALLALRNPAAVPPRRRVVHQHGPGLRPAARDAHAASRSTRACATRSWRSWTGSGGSRASATSGSSTGS